MNILKGLDGERKVVEILERNGYRFVEDIYLPTRTGTTQIDSVVLTSSGVYVIEVKNIAGIVKVRDSDTWINKQGRKEYKIYNPVLQNTGHIRNLRRELKERVIMNNVVVFPDTTEIVKEGGGDIDRVINYKDLAEYLTGPTVLGEDEINRLEDKIRGLKDKYSYLFFEHLK